MGNQDPASTFFEKIALFGRRSTFYSVFQNKTEFKVKILTNPEPYTGTEPETNENNGPDNRSQKYWFKGRILDPNMAHEKFLPDPCDPSIASDSQASLALASLHTTIYADEKPEGGVGSIITAFIQPGANNNKYDLQFMRYLRTDIAIESAVSLPEKCQLLADLDWSEYGITPAANEEYTIDQITFESIPQPLAADRALLYHQMIGESGINESNKRGRTKIVETIHAPTYAAYRDQPMPEELKQEYIDELTSRAWSSWFLNACYIDKNGPGFSQFKKNALKFEDSGCCYPNPFAAVNRNEVFNNPEKYINQTILLVFSNVEIESKPSELGLVYGDASIVGQTNVYKSWEETRNEFENKSGVTHLNVYVGDKTEQEGYNFIGGNLGDTTAYRSDLDKFGFLKLVKIVSFNP